jgi:CHAD domain-containing protein
MAKQPTVKGIRADLPLEKCGGKIILQRFDEMWRLRAGTVDGQDIECLHDMRVASRRLRAAMADLAQCFPGRPFRKRRRQVKQLTETLGEVRDMDVMIDFYQQYRQKLRPEEQPALDELIHYCQRLRQQRRARLLELFDKLQRKEFAARFEQFFQRRRGR